MTVRRSWRNRIPGFAVGSVLLALAPTVEANECVKPADLWRQLAELQRKHGTDQEAIVRSLDRYVGLETDDPSPRPYASEFPLKSLAESDAGAVEGSLHIGTPYSQFRVLVWPVLAGSLSPRRVEVQDVLKVMVTIRDRDPRAVDRLTVERNGRSLTGTRLGNSWDFDCAVFASGGKVVATVTLRDGATLAHTFTPSELASLK